MYRLSRSYSHTSYSARLIPYQDSCQAYPNLTVPLMECHQHTDIRGKRSEDNEDMENLMRRKEVVESTRIESLWNSIRADCGPRQMSQLSAGTVAKKTYYSRAPVIYIPPAARSQKKPISRKRVYSP